MNPPDRTFRELAVLYDFFRELRKYRIQDANAVTRPAPGRSGAQSSTTTRKPTLKTGCCGR